MSSRAQQLHKTADCQIAELIQRLSTAGGQGLTRPCPSRERLGDGTVGAVAAHTTDNYQRIARFVAAIQDGGPQHHSDVQHHHPGQHAEGDRVSEIELDVLLVRLAAARDALATIGQLSDEQLDSIPPAGEMKFADGQRTLEQIVASLLKHQRHQVRANSGAVVTPAVSDSTFGPKSRPVVDSKRVARREALDDDRLGTRTAL